MKKEYINTNCYCKNKFGKKLYKLSLSAATSCPNRDGKVGVGGCIFCSANGSGDFAESSCLPLSEQIENAKKKIGKKANLSKYIAYFQSFTGTYGDLEALEKIYIEAANREDIAAVSIATRPDCLGEKALAMLGRISKIKPLWVELGFQTSNEKTAEIINRCYKNDVYVKAMQDLEKLGIHRITHIILGLPHETQEDMLNTVKFVSKYTDGVKIQLLHVLKNTRLAEMYENGEFKTLEPEEYYSTVANAIMLLPDDIVVHRITGDGAKKDLLAPLWSGDKKRVLNDLNKALKNSGIVLKQ